MNIILNILTEATCGDGCWHAREDVCRCSCGGRNHGILLSADGVRPQRTARIGGDLYELAAILPYPPKTAFIETIRAAQSEMKRLISERFPNIDDNAYGAFRPHKNYPVLERGISKTQQKWAEAVAVPYAARMIWSRPAGSEYAQLTPSGGTTFRYQDIQHDILR